MRITICGSAKFEDLWHFVSKVLTLDGHVVYEMAVFPSYEGEGKDWYTDDEKEVLDWVHLCKIDNSDGVVVINAGGYIGESTAREIRYAESTNKPVWFLEQLLDFPDTKWNNIPSALGEFDEEKLAI